MKIRIWGGASGIEDFEREIIKNETKIMRLIRRLCRRSEGGGEARFIPQKLIDWCFS